LFKQVMKLMFFVLLML